MSQPTRQLSDLTFEDIRSGVCSTVSSIRQRIPKRICSHFNEIPLTLAQVRKYCDWNWEMELWERPLPDGMKGLTICEQGVFIVVCNAKEKNPLVCLKIILHELGHYLLHRRFLESGICAWAGNEWFSDQSEKEANLFALMSMVPDKQVKVICTEHEVLEDRIQHLRDTYAFTRQEAVVRIAACDANLRNNSYEEMFEQFLDGYEP